MLWHGNGTRLTRSSALQSLIIMQPINQRKRSCITDSSAPVIVRLAKSPFIGAALRQCLFHKRENLLALCVHQSVRFCMLHLAEIISPIGTTCVFCPSYSIQRANTLECIIPSTLLGRAEIIIKSWYAIRLVVCIKFYEWREGAGCIIHATVLRVLISLAVLIMRDVQRTHTQSTAAEAKREMKNAAGSSFMQLV